MKRLVLYIMLAVGLTSSAQTALPDSTQGVTHCFSVSADTRVRFAPGNLQYQASADGVTAQFVLT